MYNNQVQRYNPSCRPSNIESNPRQKQSTPLEKIIWKERLGNGAFGVVHRAYDRELQKYVAIKCLEKSKIGALGSISYVISEKNTLRDLTQDRLSKYIVHFYGCEQDQRFLYLKMELVNGCNLAEKIRISHFFTFNQTQYYTAQIICGLDFIQQFGIIHRDLKPENIMITMKEEVKITDFGLAKKLKEHSRCYETCGTYGYMAPEVYHPGVEGYGLSIDWYSLGIMIYQMRTGRLTIEDLDYEKYGAKHHNFKRSLMYYFEKQFLRPNTVRVILCLTLKDPVKRLEYARRIHTRSFFKGINWNSFE